MIEFKPVQVESDPYAICVDCPVCKRTVWRGQTCYHGAALLSKKDERPADDKEPERKRT